MGTLTAGIKEIFSSAKTTGSNVMLCGNDGTPDGHMTMANLASVLGGTFRTIEINDGDLNNYHQSGLYTAHRCTNAPTGDYTVMLILCYGGYECVQIAFNILGGDCYRRVYVNGVWAEWYHWG